MRGTSHAKSPPAGSQHTDLSSCSLPVAWLLEESRQLREEQTALLHHHQALLDKRDLLFHWHILSGDPQAMVTAIEAFLGLLIEVTFIATLTQRLFSS